MLKTIQGWSYAVLPGDEEGQSKLVAIEQGDDNAGHHLVRRKPLYLFRQML